MGDFKPADVYVGVMELFTVLLPGAFLVAGALLALPDAGLVALRTLLPNNAVQWVTFGFCAYAAGAFVFPVASLLDPLYEPYREWKRPLDKDHEFVRATQERCRVLGTKFADHKSDNPMNTFRWAKAMLLLHAPGAFGDVQRYEAESKFFRSLAVALPIVGVLAVIHFHKTPCAWLAVLASTVVLIGLSLWRYAEQRFKSTEWAYRYVIVLRRAPPGP